ncbi:MAG: hypothetical protein ACLFVP_06475 [Candidatus Bathyarchaeia archaeon]
MDSFKFMGCETGLSRLEIIKPDRRDIPCLTLPMTAYGEVEGDLLFLDSDIRVDEEDLSERIVTSYTRPSFVREEETGVSGFIWMHPYPFMGKPTGCIHSVVPSVSIRYEDGMILKRLLNRHGKVRARVTAKCNIFEGESWNVCGEVK